MHFVFNSIGHTSDIRLNMRNASNDLTFDSVEPPVDTSTPRFFYSAQKAILTVSMEIQKDAIFDRLKIKRLI
jgi:hypothetical protein